MAKKGDGDKTKAQAPPAEHWGNEPDDHDYPAAAAYLSLLCPEAEVSRLVAALREAPIERQKAKDLLRASRLALLPVDNAHVVVDLAKVKQGKKLSPVLLVRGDVGRDVPLTIADGYHRVCASYHLDENADIPCHLVDLAPPRSRAASRTRSSRGPATVQ
jgi:hypothetical protein